MDTSQLATPELGFDEKLRTVFQSSNFDAEYESQVIHGVLRSAGIDSLIVGDPVLPTEFQVRVPDHQFEIARNIIEAAKLPPEDEQN